jgi:hypothetical protein
MIYSSKVVPVLFIDRKVQMNCRLGIKLVYFIKYNIGCQRFYRHTFTYLRKYNIIEAAIIRDFLYIYQRSLIVKTR